MDTQVLVTIGEEGAGLQRLEEVELALRRELLTCDVAEVRQVQVGEAPEGSRAIELAAVGTMLVALEGSGQAIGGSMAAVKSWPGRAHVSRTVHLTVAGRALRLSASTDAQQQLVEEFVRAMGRTQAS